jgi:O-antigen ligase
VGAVLLVLVAFAFVPGLQASVNSRTNDQGPVWDRLNSDAAALRMVSARPALGFGWGNFGKDSVPYYRLAGTYPLSSITVAHNMLLSNATELGCWAPACGSWSSSWASWVRPSGARHRRSSPGAWRSSPG